jgi:hypothetical protein
MMAMENFVIHLSLILMSLTERGPKKNILIWYNIMFLEGS